MILHGERSAGPRPQAPRSTAVEQRDMRHFQRVGQAVRIDHEAMILAGDLDLAGCQILDWMVGAAMAAIHLVRRAPSASAIS